MTTKTAGHNRITGILALDCEAQEAIDSDDPVMITGDYEVHRADGTRPVLGTASVPNRKRISSVSGTSVNNPKVPGAITVEARGYSVLPTDFTGSAFDAGVEIGVGSDGRFYPMGASNTPVDESQTVTISGAPTGGAFKLTFAGQQTANIAFNASAADVQTALEDLSNVTPGDVVVTGSAGGPYTVKFEGQYAEENVAAMTVSNTFTGGTSPSVAVATATQGSGSTLAYYGISLTACSGRGAVADLLAR